jgi:hypothetical protein
MSRRVDRHGRVTDRAITLFKLAVRLEHEGLSTDSEEYAQVSEELHKELGLRPYDVNVLDVTIDALPAPSLDTLRRNSVMRAVGLRRQLVLANH